MVGNLIKRNVSSLRYTWLALCEKLFDFNSWQLL